MASNRIVIDVQGGVVNSVHADFPVGVEVMVIDRDNIEAGDPFPDAFDFTVERLEPDTLSRIKKSLDDTPEP